MAPGLYYRCIIAIIAYLSPYMKLVYQPLVPKRTSHNHCFLRLSATRVTTQWLKSLIHPTYIHVGARYQCQLARAHPHVGFTQLLLRISFWQLLIKGCPSFTLCIVWLHHTAHCTAVSVHLRMGSASVERVVLGEVGCCAHGSARFGCKKATVGIG